MSKLGYAVKRAMKMDWKKMRQTADMLHEKTGKSRAWLMQDMLRCALRWKREADCLNAAIINILEAGWRTEGMTVPGNNVTTAPEMVRLVCEQVALVGRLMDHEGGVLL